MKLSNKFIEKSIFALTLLILIKGNVFPQSVVRKPGLGSKNFSPKINKKNPGVYLTFEKFDFVKDPNGDKYAKIAWLQLHNNYKWNISTCYFEGSPSNRSKVTLHYYIEEIPRYRELKTVTIINGVRQETQTKPKQDIPDGFPPFHGCNPFVLKGSQSVRVSVPSDYFLKDTRVRINFYFQWEDVDLAFLHKEPNHAVYFYASDLPKDK